MCKGLFVCHGDKVTSLKSAYAKPEHQVTEDDCKPALYYITNDGKYAVDIDHVSAYQLMSGQIDLDAVPKIPLGESPSSKPRAKGKKRG